jgi:hypothetical protein
MPGYLSLRTRLGNRRVFTRTALLIAFAASPSFADCSDALPAGARSVGTVVSMKGGWTVRVLAQVQPSVAAKDYSLAPGCSLPARGLVISTSPPEKERSIYIQSPTLDEKGSSTVTCKKTSVQCSLVLPKETPGVFSQLFAEVLKVFSRDPGRVTLALTLAGSPPDRIVTLQNGQFDIAWFLQGVPSGDYKVSFASMSAANGPAVSTSFHWDGQQGAISLDGIRPGLYKVAISNPNQDAWMLLANAGQADSLLRDEGALRGVHWPPDTEIQQRTLLRAFLAYAAPQVEKP